MFVQEAAINNDHAGRPGLNYIVGFKITPHGIVSKITQLKKKKSTQHQ